MSEGAYLQGLHHSAIFQRRNALRCDSGGNIVTKACNSAGIGISELCNHVNSSHLVPFLDYTQQCPLSVVDREARTKTFTQYLC